VIDWVCTCQVGKRVIIPAEYANKILKIIYKLLKFKAMENESNKQTAVEWLEEIYLEIGIDRNVHFSQAKQMEKEQMWAYIKEKYCIGSKSLEFHKLEFEQYYEQTYGGNK